MIEKATHVTIFWNLARNPEKNHQKLAEKNIFLGEFVKAILKINAIAKELEKVCESVNNVSILNVLRAIGPATLKSVCTTQSLYV